MDGEDWKVPHSPAQSRGKEKKEGSDDSGLRRKRHKNSSSFFGVKKRTPLAPGGPVEPPLLEAHALPIVGSLGVSSVHRNNNYKSKKHNQSTGNSIGQREEPNAVLYWKGDGYASKAAR